jgi:hypothetical protein
MKTSLMSLTAFVAAVLLMAGTQGCYTQFSAAREEPVYEDDANEAVALSDTGEGAAEEGEYDENQAQPQSDYGQDWSCQMRVGMDYYYPSTYWPSVGFTVAYNSPYYGWYDPWYSYGYPYYGYGYGGGYGYGYPYYPYDPYYGYPGYWYPTEVVPWQNREFGSTRGSGNTRGSRTAAGSRGVNANNDSRAGITDPLQQMDLPAASGRTVTGGTAAGKRNASSATSARPSRSNGSSRKDITRKVDKKLSPGQQGSRSARDNQRLYRDRSGVSGSSRSKNSDGTPSVQSPSSGGASSRGSSARPSGSSPPPRSSGSSVRSAPAPSMAPAPAPRSGGSAPSGGGRSGGGGGGGRSGGGGRR